MIDKILLPVFAQKLKLYAVRSGSPLEIKQSDVVGDLLPPGPRFQHPLHYLVVVAFDKDVAVGLYVSRLVLIPRELSVLGLNLLLAIS